jgi:hypothetical protein
MMITAPTVCQAFCPTLQERWHYCPHFRDKDTEAPRGEITYLKPSAKDLNQERLWLPSHSQLPGNLSLEKGILIYKPLRKLEHWQRSGLRIRVRRALLHTAQPWQELKLWPPLPMGPCINLGTILRALALSPVYS